MVGVLAEKLYNVYRRADMKGYPITREFINDCLSEHDRRDLIDIYVEIRQKYEDDTELGHAEAFWAMYNELD